MKDVFRGLVAGLLTVDLLGGGVLLEDGGAGEAEELGIREEVFDRLVVVSELGAVALVEDDVDALFGDGLIAFLFNLAMNQLSNLISAFVWFSYWDGSMLICIGCVCRLPCGY